METPLRSVGAQDGRVLVEGARSVDTGERSDEDAPRSVGDDSDGDDDGVGRDDVGAFDEGTGVGVDVAPGDGAGRGVEGALDDGTERGVDVVGLGRDHDGVLLDEPLDERLGVAGTARGDAPDVLIEGRDGTPRLELLELLELDLELLGDGEGAGVLEDSLDEDEDDRFFLSPPASSCTGPSC